MTCGGTVKYTTVISWQLYNVVKNVKDFDDVHIILNVFLDSWYCCQHFRNNVSCIKTVEIQMPQT